MRVQRVQRAPAAKAERHTEHGPARLHGRRPLLARGVWLALVVLTLAVFSASLPVYWAQLRTICVDPGAGGAGCAYVQLSSPQAKALQTWGLTASVYAATMVALTLALVGVCLAVGALIAWRRPNDRMAMLVALMLAPAGLAWVEGAVPQHSPVRIANAGVYLLLLALFVLVFSLFPTGRFVPHWTRWTAIASLVAQVPSTLFPTAPFALAFHLEPLGYLVMLGEGGLLVAVQVYRYRRVSSPLERQQTKWVVVGLAVPIAVSSSGTLLYLLFQALAAPGSPDTAPYQPVLNIASNGLLLLVPLAFGVAMLRYRLWDIDTLINRALIYGILTLTLTGVYVGLVIGLQALLGSIGHLGPDSTLAVVLSTLVIVLLVQPLRRGIQRIIDQRFYRRKYDATKVLAAFSTTLQQEVDLDRLGVRVLAVVQETMQPAHAALWLRPSPWHKGGRSIAHSWAQRADSSP